MLNIVPIEVDKELLQPLIHDLVIGPSNVQFCQENISALTCFLTQRREDPARQVMFDRFAVSLVEFSRPVIRRTLGAHVVTSSVESDA